MNRSTTMSSSATSWASSERQSGSAHRPRLARAFEELTALITTLGETGVIAERASADRRADLVITNGNDSPMVHVQAKWSGGASNAREGILTVLHSERRAFETHEIVQGVQRLGVVAQAATTRSLLSKMADNGQVRKLRRGLYFVADDDVTVPSLVREDPVVMSHERRRVPAAEQVQDALPPSGPRPAPAHRHREQLTVTGEGAPSPGELREVDSPPLSDEEYAEWSRDAERAHLAQQADPEETSS